MPDDEAPQSLEPPRAPRTRFYPPGPGEAGVPRSSRPKRPVLEYADAGSENTWDVQHPRFPIARFVAGLFLGLAASFLVYFTISGRLVPIVVLVFCMLAAKAIIFAIC